MKMLILFFYRRAALILMAAERVVSNCQKRKKKTIHIEDQMMTFGRRHSFMTLLYTCNVSQIRYFKTVIDVSSSLLTKSYIQDLDKHLITPKLHNLNKHAFLSDNLLSYKSCRNGMWLVFSECAQQLFITINIVF